MTETRADRTRQGEPEIFSLAQILHLMRIEFARAQRYGYSLACLLIAVDRLGHVRDVYGYDAKQAVLDEVARLLQSETRSCDFLGRLMDDRLLAIVPHTTPESARVLGQRLLAHVRQLSFESGGERIPVSASIGVTHNGAGETLFFDSMLQVGEAALEEAASAGGDRLVVRDPGSASG